VAIYAAALSIASSSARLARARTVAVRLACPAVRSEGCAGVLRAGGAGVKRFRVPAGATRTVRLTLPARLAAAVRRHGRTRVRVTARDGVLQTAPITRWIVVRSEAGGRQHHRRSATSP
jgi:hypothetical protein